MSRELDLRIYHELKQSTTNYYYIEGLMDQQSKRSKIYNACVAVFSSGGALSALINIFKDTSFYAWLSVISSCIAALIVITNQFSPLFIMSHTDMATLSKLHVEFSRYSDALQNLLNKTRNNEINDNKAGEILLGINNQFAMHKIEASRIFGDSNNKIAKEAAKRSDEYLDSIYNID